MIRHLCILVLIVAACVIMRNDAAKCERDVQQDIPKFMIDLDKPPIERFKEVAIYFDESIQLLVKQFKR